jgi:hypothetical protein
MYDLLQHSKDKLNPELELQIRCLKAVIVTNAQIQGQEEEVVTMEQFGKVLAWFGNLKTDGIAILEKIRQTMAFGWFHGDVSMPESEARLNNKVEGTFLVRFSTSEVGVFTISKVSATGISHQRIQRTHGQYIVNKKGYPSIVSLVENESHNLNLQTACGGSRFAVLFRRQQLHGYLNDG